MKREGVFCDFTFGPPGRTCPNVAVGACVSCGKDACENHGSANGLSVSIRYEADGGGTVEMATAGIVVCRSCLFGIKPKQAALREHLMPGLIAQAAEGLRVTLAMEAMKADPE